MLICWSGYAAIILYLNYGYSWDRHSNLANILLTLGCYLVFSLLFGLASLILLEIIQQVEGGKPLSLWRAVADALVRDLWKAFPLLIVWGFVWFVLSLLSALFSRNNKNGSGTEEDFSARNAVGTLLGVKGGFSLSSAFFNALSKGVRMVIFLMLPAIAWEDFSSWKAFRKGLDLLRDI